MSKRKGKREARLPVAANLPVIFTEEEDAIIRTIDHWYDLLAAVLTAEAGQRVMQHKFKQVLEASGNDPKTIAVVFALAEAGHQSAYFAARDYAAKLLEYEPELPAQLRAYLIRLLYMPPPAHPQSRGEVVDHLTRDTAIRLIVDLVV